MKLNDDRPGDPIEGCPHPIARHRHGTHVGFVICKCRCDECRGANTRYEVMRSKRTEPAYVPATKARAHLQWLMSQGMSEKQIRKVSGLGSNISRLVYPNSSIRPAKRIRRETEARILAIPLLVSEVADVDPTEFNGILEELLARGWTRWKIATHLGAEMTSGLQVGRHGRIQAGKLRKIRRLLFMPVPTGTWGPRDDLPKRTVVKDTGHRAWPAIGTTPGVPLEPKIAELMDKLRLRELRRGLMDAVRESAKRHGYISPLVRDLAEEKSKQDLLAR